ncbi:hypothetical protein PMO31116_04151 [Pandoraea morbifera]|uniref:Uncharacterized protein n=1 Tax=Pandoraea morbifera TaxID=2508300 RepID=A0A5E4Y088_9BURK|nr:hypothetical protein [Pandoraea morbifera]VVE41698.1 hypothetical protein PMO31116_04151 [Pandoraea morbifera]
MSAATTVWVEFSDDSESRALCVMGRPADSPLFEGRYIVEMQTSDPRYVAFFNEQPAAAQEYMDLPPAQHIE